MPTGVRQARRKGHTAVPIQAGTHPSPAWKFLHYFSHQMANLDQPMPSGMARLQVDVTLRSRRGPGAAALHRTLSPGHALTCSSPQLLGNKVTLLMGQYLAEHAEPASCSWRGLGCEIGGRGDF